MLSRPHGPVLEASAFGKTFKLLAFSLITGILLWGAYLWKTAHFDGNLDGWLIAATAMLVYTEFHIFRSKTRLGLEDVQQTWVWRKQVNFKDIAYIKVFRVAGFDWLVAPRVYVRTHANKFMAFYVSSEVMIDAFKAMESELIRERSF